MFIKKAVVLFDIHFPNHQKKQIELIQDLCYYEEPDCLIYGGDQLDMAPLSHWNDNKPQKMENQRVASHYNDFDNEILKPFEKVCKKAKKVWIVGNHEDWAREKVERDPQLEGIIEPENFLKLKERNYEIVPLNNIYKLGKLNIIHGCYTNQYHSGKHVNIFERNVLYGHTHTFQEFTKVSPVDTDDAHSAISIGCLCNKNPDFLEGKPNAWVNGFAVVYVWPNGNFQVFPVKIFNNQFVFNNRLYK